MNSAISIRVHEVEQMKLVASMVRDQFAEAESEEQEGFVLDLDKKPKSVNNVKFRSTLKFKSTETQQQGAERGFNFFDRMMRQAPRPGTIRQEVK